MTATNAISHPYGNNPRPPNSMLPMSETTAIASKYTINHYAALRSSLHS